MKTTVDHALHYITRNLTGKRETDIAFLQKQIDFYQFDPRVVSGLERILKCLIIPAAKTAAA